MRPTKWTSVLLTVLMLTSCASYRIENQMHKIELGMSKKKVVSVLGKNYDTVGASVTPEGSFERISYPFANILNEDGYYILSFKDNVLVEWFKEKKLNRNHYHEH
ncbi:hypothetical protein [Parabacteroides chinchillae]